MLEAVLLLVVSILKGYQPGAARARVKRMCACLGSVTKKAWNGKAHGSFFAPLALLEDFRTEKTQ
jgi:hypothetical protein